MSTSFIRYVISTGIIFWVLSLLYWYVPKDKNKKIMRKLYLKTTILVLVFGFLISIITAVSTNSNVLSVISYVFVIFMMIAFIPFSIDILVYNQRKIRRYNQYKKKGNKLSDLPNKIIATIMIVITAVIVITTSPLTVNGMISVIMVVLVGLLLSIIITEVIIILDKKK